MAVSIPRSTWSHWLRLVMAADHEVAECKRAYRGSRPLRVKDEGVRAESGIFPLSLPKGSPQPNEFKIMIFRTYCSYQLVKISSQSSYSEFGCFVLYNLTFN